MVKAPKKNFSPHPVGKFGKSTKQYTHWRHQVNEGKSGLQAETVRVLGASRSLRSKKKLSVEKMQKMHCSSNEEKENWIEDYVERETAVARKQVQDAATAIMQELHDMTTADNTGATTRKPDTISEKMLNATRPSWSDVASSDDEQSGEDEEDDEVDTELGKLSDDEETGWVMATISKTVQHCMESFRQKQIRHDELTQPGKGNAANYFRERDMKYGTVEWMVLAVFQPQKDTTAATPSPTTFGEHMQTHDNSTDKSKYRQWLLAHEVVKWGWVQRNQSHTNSYQFFRLNRRMIRHRFRMQRLLHQ